MKYWVTATVLLALAGAALAREPQPQQQVLVQFSVGTGTTLVGFKVARCSAPADDESVSAPGRFCLRLPFGCALVMESASADGSSVVVRPQIGPIAFEVAVGPARSSESGAIDGTTRSPWGGRCRMPCLAFHLSRTPPGSVQ
jgi:hypothetical protein